MTTFSRITFDPNLYYGKPIIRGTRIPVYCILELIEEGLTFEQIISDNYPGITVEDVKECVKLATYLLKDEAINLPYPEK